MQRKRLFKSNCSKPSRQRELAKSLMRNSLRYTYMLLISQTCHHRALVPQMTGGTVQVIPMEYFTLRLTTWTTPSERIRTPLIHDHPRYILLHPPPMTSSTKRQYRPTQRHESSRRSPLLHLTELQNHRTRPSSRRHIRVERRYM